MNEKKKLVAYFSASGVTAQVAERLARAADADLFAIKPVTPYTEADLDWRDAGSRSSVEMKDPAFRPAIADRVGDMAAYDTVFVGFPIWWYVAPSIINTFLESYDFTGKTLIPFATSGTSGMGETDEKLHALCPAAVRWKPGKRLDAKVSEAALKSWVGALGL